MTLDELIVFSNEDEVSACRLLLTDSEKVLSAFQSEDDLIYYFTHTKQTMGLLSFQLFASYGDRIADRISSVQGLIKLVEVAAYKNIHCLFRSSVKKLRQHFQNFDDLLQLLLVNTAAAENILAKKNVSEVLLRFRQKIYDTATISDRFLQLAKSEQNSSMEWTIKLLKIMPRKNIEVRKLNQLWDLMYANPKLKIYQIEGMQRRIGVSPLKFSGIFQSNITLAETQEEALSYTTSL